jgi:CRISPR/Cas system-associated protein Csx1
VLQKAQREIEENVDLCQSRRLKEEASNQVTNFIKANYEQKMLLEMLVIFWRNKKYNKYGMGNASNRFDYFDTVTNAYFFSV